jgi:hypothetical protein
LAFLDFAGARADLRLRVVAAIFVTVSSEFKTSEMIEHAALQVSLARVLLVAVRGQNYHYCQKKVPLEQKAVPAKNGIHVFPTIFTLAAGFLLASCDKKVTYVTQRFFWRRREVQLDWMALKYNQTEARIDGNVGAFQRDGGGTRGGSWSKCFPGVPKR